MFQFVAIICIVLIASVASFNSPLKMGRGEHYLYYDLHFHFINSKTLLY